VLALLSARELLVPARAPLRRAYWFTGGIMLLSGVGLLLRAALSASDTQMTGADTQGLQHATLLGVMVAQIGMAGGFILMTHYRTMMALQRLSEHDALTGTLNRRSMLEQARAVLELTGQRGLPAALLMVDADHFQRTNDEFGHQTGDAVLGHLVSGIRHRVRSAAPPICWAASAGKNSCCCCPAWTPAPPWMWPSASARRYTATPTSSPIRQSPSASVSASPAPAPTATISMR